MDYTSRYGLEFNPFIKNSKYIHVNTHDYHELKYRLDYLLQTKGFGLVTGEPGRGKTTSIRQWANTLNKQAFKVIYLSLSTLTVNEFYRQLADSFKIEVKHRKIDNYKAIQTAINRLVIEKKIQPIIILDEVNYMRSGILNDLKLIFNFEMDSLDRVVVLLVGLPKINNTLRLNSNEPLRQRIIMNYHLDSLNKEDGKKYILTKLKGAGCHLEIFDESSLEAILNASNGVPRIIDKLCNNCLLIANSQNKSIIDIDIVMNAANEMEIY